MSELDVIVGIGLGILSVIDIKNKRIPVWMVYLLGISCFVLRYVVESSIIGIGIMLGILPGVVLLILAICSDGKIGMGDGLVVFVLGIGYTLEEVVSILGISFFFTAICSIGLLIVKKADRKTELPFLPYLFIGHFLVSWIK